MRTVEKVAAAMAAAMLISAAVYWSFQFRDVWAQLEKAEQAEQAAQSKNKPSF